MRGWIADVRWALRLLARRRVFAATVILTLAVAFSAVASAYGIATAVLWRPLPFAQPDRLVFVWENSGTDGAVNASRVTGFRFDQWVRGSRSLESMALFGSIGLLADQGNGAVIVHGVRVSSNYFETLAISPVIGRGFAPSDSEPGQGQVVVLSHSLWTEWFGGRPDVIDRKIQLGGRPYTVIGVMPPVVFPAWPVNPAAVTLDSESRRLWVPITRTASLATAARSHVFGVVGRLREGVSMDVAQSELSQLTSTSDPDAHRAVLRPFRDQFVGDARTPLIALIGAALAVLLVACHEPRRAPGLVDRRATRRAEPACGARRRTGATRAAVRDRSGDPRHMRGSARARRLAHHAPACSEAAAAIGAAPDGPVGERGDRAARSRDVAGRNGGAHRLAARACADLGVAGAARQHTAGAQSRLSRARRRADRAGDGARRRCGAAAAFPEHGPRAGCRFHDRARPRRQRDARGYGISGSRGDIAGERRLASELAAMPGATAVAFCTTIHSKRTGRTRS